MRSGTASGKDTPRSSNPAGCWIPTIAQGSFATQALLCTRPRGGTDPDPGMVHVRCSLATGSYPRLRPRPRSTETRPATTPRAHPLPRTANPSSSRIRHRLGHRRRDPLPLSPPRPPHTPGPRATRRRKPRRYRPALRRPGHTPPRPLPAAALCEPHQRRRLRALRTFPTLPTHLPLLPAPAERPLRRAAARDHPNRMLLQHRAPRLVPSPTARICRHTNQPAPQTPEKRTPTNAPDRYLRSPRRQRRLGRVRRAIPGGHSLARPEASPRYSRRIGLPSPDNPGRDSPGHIELDDDRTTLILVHDAATWRRGAPHRDLLTSSPPSRTCRSPILSPLSAITSTHATTLPPLPFHVRTPIQTAAVATSFHVLFSLPATAVFPALFRSNNLVKIRRFFALLTPFFTPSQLNIFLRFSSASHPPISPPSDPLSPPPEA